VNKKINPYTKYSVQDFDIYNCLKISKILYISLLFILRGYVVWIMSVTNMRDKVEIIQWIYPDTHLFFISLLSGTLGLYVVLILSLRRPNAAQWVINSWRYCRVILICALFFDLTISYIGYFYWQLLSESWVISQTFVVAVLTFLCFKSKKVGLNLADFPKEFLQPKSKNHRSIVNKNAASSDDK
jgi:hypothetical protein